MYRSIDRPIAIFSPGLEYPSLPVVSYFCFSYVLLFPPNLLSLIVYSPASSDVLNITYSFMGSPVMLLFFFFFFLVNSPNSQRLLVKNGF